MMSKSVQECIAQAEELLVGATADLRRYSGMPRAEVGAQLGEAWALLAQVKLAAEMNRPVELKLTGWVAEAARSHVTDRCGHNVLAMQVGDRWVHVASMNRCVDPPVTDGPMEPVTEAP
jgi:hypothetical protein